MLILFLSLLSCITIQAAKLPEFNDPIYGLLIVSRKNPPFLTRKAYPNQAYYVPTDQQLEDIRNAVYGKASRLKRSNTDSDNSNSYTIEANSSWSIEKMELRVMSDGSKNSEDESLLDLPPEDFEVGMKKYANYAKYIGKMIIDMFKGYIDSKPLEPPDLHFDKFDEKTYFKATIVPATKMSAWIKDANATLRLHAEKRPYFPVQKVINELHECRSVGYSEAADKDFQFTSKTTGIMTYYKAKCMKVSKNIFVFLALNDNEFVLKSNRFKRAAAVGKEQCDCSSYMCWITACSSKMCGGKKDMFKKNRCLTPAQQAELNDYLINRVVQRILIDFKNKIDVAKEELQKKPGP